MYKLEDLMRSPTTEEVNEAVENLDEDLSCYHNYSKRQRKAKKGC